MLRFFRNFAHFFEKKTMKRHTLHTLFPFIFLSFLLLSIDASAVDTQVLADSLQALYVPFSSVWSPQVKVKYA